MMKNAEHWLKTSLKLTMLDVKRLKEIHGNKMVAQNGMSKENAV